jgi:hypothetical protein
LGGKWEEVEGVFPSPSIGHQAMEPFKGYQAMEPSKVHQAMEPFKGHQVMKPSIGHRVRIFFHLFLSPCLSKGEFGSLLALSFLDIIFNLSLENICSYNLPWEKEK